MLIGMIGRYSMNLNHRETICCNEKYHKFPVVFVGNFFGIHQLTASSKCARLKRGAISILTRGIYNNSNYLLQFRTDNSWSMTPNCS